jgi:hypothetical protein
MKPDSTYFKAVGIFTVIILVCGVLIFTKKILAWSAVRIINLDTHSLIYQAAYDQLMEYDRNARRSDFPRIGDILDFEGVIVSDTADDYAVIGGNGPDAPGKSKYSEHYYNPRNRAGNQGEAPLSVKTWFMELVEAQLEGQYQLGCRGAAWAAHFLADVHVPFHVCGVPHMVALERNQLTENESGPRDLMRYNQALAWEWGRNGDFTNNIGVFFAESRLDSKRTEEMDWFDPWYFNGTGDRILQSSHITWERHAHKLYTRGEGYTIDEEFRYHAFWENDYLDIDDPMLWYPQAYQTQVFAEKIAANTRRNLEYYLNNPVISIHASIWSVITLWRASFSALKADVQIQVSKKDKNSLNVYAILSNADSSHAAYDVWARILIITPDGERIEGKKKVSEGLRPRDTDEAQWSFRPEESGEFKFKVEAICHYDNDLPDLQYAVAEENYRFTAARTYEDPKEDSGLEGDWELRGNPALRFKLKAGEYTGYSLDPNDSPKRIRFYVHKESKYQYRGSYMYHKILRNDSSYVSLPVEVIFSNPDTIRIKFKDPSGEPVELGPFTRIR